MLETFLIHSGPPASPAPAADNQQGRRQQLQGPNSGETLYDKFGVKINSAEETPPADLFLVLKLVVCDLNKAFALLVVCCGQGLGTEPSWLGHPGGDRCHQDTCCPHTVKRFSGYW